MTTFDIIVQLGIALFGVTAVGLSQSAQTTYRKWAPVVGLIGQPFWFVASWTGGQWGIFALAFVYTACWMLGIRTYWMRAI